MTCPRCHSEDVVHTLPAVASEHRLVYLRCASCGHQWTEDPDLNKPKAPQPPKPGDRKS
jgi:uncharacterized Zn finger protein